MGVGETVTVAVADRLEPSALDAVIVVEPSAIAVTIPFVTVAIDGLLDAHDSSLLDAFTGNTFAVNCDVCDGIRLIVLELNVIPDTGMGGLRIYVERVSPLILPRPVQLS